VPRGGAFKLRVLLVVRDMDADSCEDAILLLTRLCIKAEWTLLLAFAAAAEVLVTAQEEEPPSASRLAEFYGKVVVCLHEAFSGQGFQLQRSVDAILRNAKLKAPA
jgi:hypothetical protein